MICGMKMLKFILEMIIGTIIAICLVGIGLRLGVFITQLHIEKLIGG